MEAGFELPQAGVFVMSFGIMAHPFMAGMFYAFLSQNPIIIAAVVIVYFVAYFLFRKNREKVVDWLENYGTETAAQAA